MGPGIGFYGINAELNTTLSPEDENAFFEALNSILSEKNTRVWPCYWFRHSQQERVI